MTNIIDSLVERLRQAGPSQWERIATESGVGKHLPRKLVYGDRRNPTVGTVQRLTDYFAARDSEATAAPADEVR